MAPANHAVDLDQLRESVSITDMIAADLGPPEIKNGEYHKWLCPFHPDRKSPSLTAYLDTNKFYCFGCGEAGSVFDWVQKRHNSTFAEAVQVVQGNAQIPRTAIPQQQRQQMRQERQAEATQLLAKFRRDRVWEQYQDNMTPEWWTHLYQTWGVQEPMGRLHGIGYCPDFDGHPTFTIPFLYGRGLRCRVVKHRLLDTDTSGEKYRYEPNKQTQCLYLTQPDKPWNGHIVAVEGEWKSIVVNQALADPDTVVVGLPGMTPSTNVRRQLRVAEHVTLVMDPDVAESEQKRQAVRDLVDAIGREKTSLLVPPDKIDDWILDVNATAYDVRRLLRQARRCK